ncbi:MAG TPA: ABC transporter permease [Acidimicrobiales bacterium]|nr:ABC transporter permease [Acidimicrobiales bacterium]
MASTEAAEPAPSSKGRRSSGMWRGLRSPKIVVGLVIVAIFVLVAIFGPLFVSQNPSAMTTAVLAPPSGHHLLGTTQTGQDIFAQLIIGTRVSMLVGFISAIIATFLALLIGLAAGYLGGVADEVLSALANIFLVIPGLPLVIVLAGYLPSKGSLSVAVVIAVTGWAWGSRVLRAQTLSIARRDFIQAARASGERPLRIIFAEILPNQLAIVAAGFLGTVIYAILTQASLAFLGLSDVSTWSWGTILYWAENNQALEIGAWWWFVPPGLAIAVIGTGLTLVNFGIDEFVNPRLRVAGIGTKAWGKAMRKNALRPGATGDRPGGSAHWQPKPAFTPVARAGEAAK